MTETSTRTSVISLVGLALWLAVIGIAIYAARDMRRQGRRGWLYGVAIVVAVPLGLGWWLWSREQASAGAKVASALRFRALLFAAAFGGFAVAMLGIIANPPRPPSSRFVGLITAVALVLSVGNIPLAFLALDPARIRLRLQKAAARRHQPFRFTSAAKQIAVLGVAMALVPAMYAFLVYVLSGRVPQLLVISAVALLTAPLTWVRTGTAITMLATTPTPTATCANGHPMEATDRFCVQCGAPRDPGR